MSSERPPPPSSRGDQGAALQLSVMQSPVWVLADDLAPRPDSARNPPPGRESESWCPGSSATRRS